LERRLASLLFLPTAASCHEAFKEAQLDKANVACAKADAARPDEGFFQAAPRLSLLRLLELELTQTQMAQKPMLRAEVHARALRASPNLKRAELWVGARCV